MIVKNRLLDLSFDIYQNEEWFKFSLDSVLLASFVTLNLRTKMIMDMATGNAPIPLLLTYRTTAKIYGVEYQKCVYDLAVQSVLANRLEDKIQLLCEDVCNLKKCFKGDTFDVITCNPPYFKVKKASYLNDNSVKAIARHELTLNLSDVVMNAVYLLKNGGIFAMVHRTERLVEILEIFKRYGIEPKRIQFIYPKAGKNSDLFLIEGMKNGNPGLKLMSPLIIHKDNGDYTDEVQDILKFNYERC